MYYLSIICLTDEKCQREEYMAVKKERIRKIMEIEVKISNKFYHVF